MREDVPEQKEGNRHAEKEECRNYVMRVKVASCFNEIRIISLALSFLYKIRVCIDR